jgi:hypothetical protein
VRALVRASRHRVRLTAQDPHDMADVRLRRAIAVHVGGRWRDLGEMLIEEGHAVWLDGIVETKLNRPYALAEQRARLRGRNMWDPTHCGVGPSQDVPLKVWANWDPDGSDAQHLDAEWTKLRNLSTTRSISLAHWWLRDSMLRRYTFPRGTTLAPGATLTVYTGPGPNSPLVRHWGLHETIFENPGDSRDLGDGAYVFDPQGDLRSAFVYPCLLACRDPLQGAVAIDAHPRGEEYADLRNVSGGPVDLYGYRLDKPGFTYAFGPDSVLRPGETMRVYVNGSPSSDSRLVRHWGINQLLLRDGGDHLEVSTFDGIRLACAAWGDDGC